MNCKGDGWHRIGTNVKVFVNNRVITECLILDENGEWSFANIRRWDRQWHMYQFAGRTTLAALRAGISRSTMTVTKRWQADEIRNGGKQYE